MARFPIPQSKIAELGRLLAEAACNETQREALRSDPAAVLRAAGFPEDLVALFEFRVVCDTETQRHVVLPYRFNAARLAAQDPAYLAQIAEMTIGQGRPN
ncbi:hypothetical protein GWI72_07395 [Microvirga tunisiensis]|uniref:Uncharacterized protein n=2 Tax=Pannonibacter tanglangensis TaxID=2750084 RepID=A0ABW9ZCP6_9HYPH|nr:MULTISPECIES: hypothetical protein [unclassified Pannonibacter]NBN62433.1 hypothetical protein [Pannonibacter sp. XCT-34]NBN78089.1 hypothetical protein [Pannonibacter sp. XCT-53]